ncbi:MAG: lytic transglycosylase domain-containing protein, partial [Clostridia bacterium]|nr:lytic transglycosylase domain-containing protein [Deltaproteobacteria bacterium]
MRLLVFAMAFLAPSIARADLYTFTDAEGVVHFTNVPRDPRYSLVPGTQNTFAEPAAPYAKALLHRVDITRYDPLIKEAASYYALPFELVKAVIAAESAFEPRAVSSAGALGLMQMLPSTARDMHVTDTFDPRDNIYGGTRYLRHL